MLDGEYPIISINPDPGSGRDYQEALGLSSTGFDGVIRPRVKGDVLTEDIGGVVKDLADSIVRALKEVSELRVFLTIACNTLSLNVFVKPALDMVLKSIPNFNEMVTVVLTIAEIKRYSEQKKGKVLVLGTKPFQMNLC